VLVRPERTLGNPPTSSVSCGPRSRAAQPRAAAAPQRVPTAGTRRGWPRSSRATRCPARAAH